MSEVRHEFAESGKRDIHGSEAEFDEAFHKLQTAEKWKFPNNQQAVIEYIQACRLGRAKSNGHNKKISKSWLYRVMGQLRKLSEDWLKKDFDSASYDEWQEVYSGFENNQIRKESGKKYSATTKAKIYKTIRKFCKWKYGDNKTYPDFCEDWVTTEPMVTKEYLMRGEVERLANGAGNLKTKCMVMMLFDGGFRIEELANLRWTDVRKPEGKDYYQAHVRPETSKTKKERFVSIPLCTDYIDNYKNSKESDAETDYMFPNNYGTFYKTIKRMIKRILNKDLSPHTFRHSSATYYAPIIRSYQLFCQRYGWNLNSAVAQRYFHRVSDEEVADQAKGHEVGRFKQDLEKMGLENKQLRERLEAMEKRQERLFAEMLRKHGLLNKADDNA